MLDCSNKTLVNHKPHPNLFYSFIILFAMRIFDCHSDFPSAVVRERSKGREKVIEEDFLEGMRESGIMKRIISIYLRDNYLNSAAHRGIQQLEETRRDINESDKLEICTTISEMEKANQKDKHAFMFSMEGGEPLEGDLALLDAFYNLGVRSLLLTHSRRNQLGTGAPIRNSERDVKDRGLSDFGLDVVERCNELGIVLDGTHLNERGFWDLIEHSDETIIASHSNAAGVHDIPRNLDDEQLKAIAESGGTVGLVSGVNLFVGDKDSDIDDFVEHLNYMVDLIGVENVGLGFDYFEYLGKYYHYDKYGDVGGIEGMSCDREVKNLEEKLIDEGYTESEIQKIFEENFKKSFREVLEK